MYDFCHYRSITCCPAVHNCLDLKLLSFSAFCCLFVEHRLVVAMVTSVLKGP